jgi:hypothetical protein
MVDRLCNKRRVTGVTGQEMGGARESHNEKSMMIGPRLHNNKLWDFLRCQTTFLARTKFETRYKARKMLKTPKNATVLKNFNSVCGKLMS